MLEYARTSQAGLVELVKPLAPGENVILADEDAAKDQELIPIGQTLRAAELGLMAAFGETVVSVRRKPKFAILATGDEVVKITDAPKIGQVRDINSIAIKALVEAAGGLGELLGLVPDDLPLLSQKVATGLALADAVVLTGGSSAGEKDYTLKALTAQPGTAALAHGVAISPGKPLIFARQGQKSLWGLPGHPAGALVTAEVFLKALIRRLTGAKEPIWPKALKARLSRSVPSAEGRRDYFRVKLTFKGQELIASPVLGKSALISTLAGADALAICPEEREGLEQGEWADIRLL
jgi:molybdopterin molybdotransferase